MFESKCDVGQENRNSGALYRPLNQNVSLREVQIVTAESNLLKLKVARSLVFSHTLQTERGVNKAVRTISMCNRSKTLVVTNGVLSTSQMKSIIQAASRRDNLEIIVSASNYANWTSVLNTTQKLKLDQVTISCMWLKTKRQLVAKKNTIVKQSLTITLDQSTTASAATQIKRLNTSIRTQNL
ncbi:hypothetical protein MBANPS3_009769 [Mucor bainieri]